MNRLIKQVEKEIKKNILPHLPIKKYILKKIYKNNNYLGFYKTGSIFNIPIIKLNLTCIKNSFKTKKLYPNFDISLYDIILTTILHELAHALQDLKGYCKEEEAEEFAYNYYFFGKIDKI